MTQLSTNGHTRERGRPAKSAKTVKPIEPDARSGAPPTTAVAPRYQWSHPQTGAHARVYVGDCRAIIPGIPECAAGTVDLVFADPPFNWNRAYDEWHDAMPDADYLDFTYAWLDACIVALAPHGALWVNIPDDWAAEIVVHLKARGLHMINWCIWHYRFGQNTTKRFINSKAHVLYFSRLRDPRGNGRMRGLRDVAEGRVWNPDQVLEPSDRATTYFDPRTKSKRDGMPPGMRMPLDVWYGRNWGRIQGNNFERRPGHDNQLPEVYLERVIRSSSGEGMLVMDPFLGSGTTGVVAHALNRRFIGIEFSESSAKSAVERMKEGPARELKGRGQSTAIFPARKRGRVSKDFSV